MKITPDTVNGKVQVQIRQKSSTYTGIRSSIVFLYHESGFQIQAVINA